MNMSRFFVNRHFMPPSLGPVKTVEPEEMAIPILSHGPVISVIPNVPPMKLQMENKPV